MRRDDLVALAALAALVHVAVAPTWQAVAALGLVVLCLLAVFASQVVDARAEAQASNLADTVEGLEGRFAALEAQHRRLAERVDSLSHAPQPRRPQL